MIIGGIFGIVIGVVFVLAGIFHWGPLVVRNQDQVGVVPSNASGYTAVMIIIGLIAIGSGIAAIVGHH